VLNNPTLLEEGAMSIQEQIRKEFPGVRLWVTPPFNGISKIDQIIVPPELRGQGVGSKIMRILIKWADQKNLTLALTPDPSFGGSVPRLKRFYAGFGFILNKGRKRDFEISELMYRYPKSNRMASVSEMQSTEKELEDLIRVIQIYRKALAKPQIKDQLRSLTLSAMKWYEWLIPIKPIPYIGMLDTQYLGRLAWYLGSIISDLKKIKKGQLNPRILGEFLENIIGLGDSNNALGNLKKQQRYLGILSERKVFQTSPGKINPALPALFQKIKELPDRILEVLTRLLNLIENEDPENLHILYHATTVSSKILLQGFLQKAPKGVGGLDTEGAGRVSFTFSLELAKEIAKIQKDLALIFRGAVTGEDLYLYAKKNRLLQTLKEDPRKITNPKKLSHIYRKMNQNMMGKGSKFFVMINHMQLMRSVGYLANVNLSEIAVLACKVDLSHKGVKFRSTEKEYQVPTGAIVEVVKKINVKPNLMPRTLKLATDLKKSLLRVRFEKKDPVTLNAELASSDFEKAKGLMFRKTLPENQGMVFPFKDSEKRTFWMLNTYLPLDIIFIGKNKKVLNIGHGFPLDDKTPVESNGPAKYVVETNAGFCQENGIGPGCQVRFLSQR